MELWFGWLYLRIQRNNKIMKVELNFCSGCILDAQNKEGYRRRDILAEKVFGKIIELPCIPTRGMIFDLHSFGKILGFTDEELEWVEYDDGVHYINDIMIMPTHLQLWMDKEDRHKIQVDLDWAAVQRGVCIKA